MSATTQLGKAMCQFKRIRQQVWAERRIGFVAAGVAGCVVILRVAGLLQSLELAALDQLFRLRPSAPVDSRIVIVSIDDADLNQVRAWPLSDALMAEVLEKINAYQPRAIGLDIYRDLPVGPGEAELQRVFQTLPHLVGIEKIADDVSFGVSPPETLKQQNQVGFNNVVVDADSRVRRALLFWTINGEARMSLSLKLALMYLDAEGVTPQPATVNPNYLQLGQAVFRPLGANDGGYVRADTGGYQILANFRHPNQSFRSVSLQRVLAGEVPPELMRDRIVLIGSTAVSLKDFFYTPYSSHTMLGAAQQISGVELHANFISQILSASLDGRSLLRVWPDSAEWLWILIWAWVGTYLSWKVRRLFYSALLVVGAGAGLSGVCYLFFAFSWWLPWVPPLLALTGAALVITGYRAHLEEELKKSKEFLHSVINTIPDPIFVKDKGHRWIVLNEAFCRLMGRPLDELLEKTDADFLPVEQAAAFWQEDELTFASGAEHESEEEFTNLHGITYLIATKRSLHCDAAGNLFLVGVIRDITQRKRMEEELRRTAAELVRSNAELRQTEDRLRQMAYHDVLTGLPNRKLLQDRLNQALEWARTHNQMVAVLFLDLDGFKLINDTHGHQMGDLLLKAVAQRLMGCLRGSDTVARLGGDEFVVLLPAIPGVPDIARVSEKILTTLAQNFALNGQTIPVTTSIGISVYPTDGDNDEALMIKADRAMYSAKELGKNRYALYHEQQYEQPEPPKLQAVELAIDSTVDPTADPTADPTDQIEELQQPR